MTWLTASLLLALAAPPTGEEVLARVDQILSPEHYTAEIRMTARRPGGETREYTYSVAKSGDDNLKLSFTGPATLSGHAALRRSSELWRYVPSLKRAMRISSRADFESGDFRNADVLRLRLARDYAVKGMRTEGALLVLDLVAKSEDAGYDAMTLWVQAADFLPVKEELYGASGKLLRVLECSAPKDFNGHIAPSMLKMSNRVAVGRTTDMEIVTLKREQRMPESTFAVEALGR
ncbi:MAG: outer membrane lipoprotein-sorting protein [Deltaproteobacteria bacterium]|nr:outer membrane lipoprotein-sorting protein [Deltaproteobacteria bacterium]